MLPAIVGKQSIHSEQGKKPGRAVCRFYNSGYLSGDLRVFGGNIVLLADVIFQIVKLDVSVRVMPDCLPVACAHRLPPGVFPVQIPVL
jgi:hypothetical protein